MNDAIIDFDKNKKGIQGRPEWPGVVRYMQHSKDTTGNGIPDIPLKYEPAQSNHIAGCKQKQADFSFVFFSSGFVIRDKKKFEFSYLLCSL